MQIKIKRRELLKLIPVVIMGGPIIASVEDAEKVEEIKEPDCYVGLLSNRDEWFGELYEIEGNGYARQGIKWKFVTEFGECKLTNTKDISFPEAKAAWGEITHFALYAEPQGGVVLFTGVLTTTGFIHTDDIARFVAGDLDITID